MKKIINDPADVVAESLRGLAVAHADILRVRGNPALVVRAAAPAPRKVAVISGGGSGHEPLHGGFVGRGMLDAAVPGPVFTSPTPDAVQAALAATTGPAGALLIVKNYTGDVLNFETAAELAAAEDLDVRSVVIDDDVAVKDSTFTAGRRGVGGTVLLEKIAGAAAERGDSLDAVEAVARKVIGQVRSIGVALTAPTVPHGGEPSFELGPDEVEFGIGIHGEPGRERIRWSRPTRWWPGWSRPSSRTCRTSRGTGCCCSPTRWAPPRWWSCTSRTGSPSGCWPSVGSWWNAGSSARTSPVSRCRG